MKRLFDQGKRQEKLSPNSFYNFGFLTELILLMKYAKNLFLLLLICLGLTACSTSFLSNELKDGPPSFNIDVSKIPNATPKLEPYSKYGNPRSYVALGHRYYVMHGSEGYRERGIASWYGTKFHEKRTSSGDPYDMLAMTAAHRTLPLPTYAKVTNLQNRKQIIVKINDRGPFADNRIIDLSYVAAKKLGILAHGTGLVEVDAIDPRSWNRHPLSPTTTKTIAVPGTPRLYTQIGSFSQYNNAQALLTKVKQLTKRAAHIENINLNGRSLYRVLIGPLSGVDESDNLTAKLSHLHLGTPMTRVE